MNLNKVKLFWFVFFAGLSFNGLGQACGFYEIKYKGDIKGDLAIREVLFPSKVFLERAEKQVLKQAQWVTRFRKAYSPKFDNLLYYSTCSAGMLAKTRINWIKENKTFLPLLVITKSGKKIWLKVPVDQIDFTEAKKDVYRVEIDFKEIKI